MLCSFSINVTADSIVTLPCNCAFVNSDLLQCFVSKMPNILAWTTRKGFCCLYDLVASKAVFFHSNFYIWILVFQTCCLPHKKICTSSAFKWLYRFCESSNYYVTLNCAGLWFLLLWGVLFSLLGRLWWHYMWTWVIWFLSSNKRAWARVQKN